MSKNKQNFAMKYYRIEINKTEWEVPDRYQMLTPVGLGAYGQVWYTTSKYLLNIYDFQ